MSTWLIVVLVIVGVLLLLGIARAIYKRSDRRSEGLSYDIGDFFLDMLILDIIFDGDMWSDIGDGFSDIGDGFGDIDFDL